MIHPVLEKIATREMFIGSFRVSTTVIPSNKQTTVPSTFRQGAKHIKPAKIWGIKVLRSFSGFGCQSRKFAMCDGAFIV
jgi:hypothetical protein